MVIIVARAEVTGVEFVTVEGASVATVAVARAPRAVEAHPAAAFKTVMPVTYKKLQNISIIKAIPQYICIRTGLIKSEEKNEGLIVSEGPNGLRAPSGNKDATRSTSVPSVLHIMG